MFYNGASLTLWKNTLWLKKAWRWWRPPWCKSAKVQKRKVERVGRRCGAGGKWCGVGGKWCAEMEKHADTADIHICAIFSLAVLIFWPYTCKLARDIVLLALC